MTLQGYQLLHEGALALSRMSANGIRVDVDYLRRAMEATTRQIAKLEEELKEDPIYTTWRKRYGSSTNLDGREQLATVLFDVMSLPCSSVTAKGKRQSDGTYKARAKADDAALRRVGLPFTDKYLEMQKKKKARDTYLKGIVRELEGEFVHPNYGLHTTRTLRGSAFDPNFQNIPIRDPVIGKLIRRAFIAREGCRLVETDFNMAEVRVAACYHHDPTMIQYIIDDYDMHRDVAAECYLINPDSYTDKKTFKRVRDTAKGCFTFAQFYGDYYAQCAANLWKHIESKKLLAPDGRGMYDWLADKGIKRLGDCDPAKRPAVGTFERHIQQVEERFWKQRFSVYDQWRRNWYNAYCRKGYFDTLTGFRIIGVHSRNFVINCPVQGSAFHCLLWSIIRIQKILDKRGMRTLLVGQIHDSLLADVPEDEMEAYCEICRDVMMRQLPKAWKWLIVPMKIEIEATPVGGNWHQKEKVAT